MNTPIRAETGDTGSDYWNGHATVLLRDAANGFLHDFAALNASPFAQMLRLLSRMPEHERAGLVIEKAGDRQYTPVEAMALVTRKDFPG